MALYIRNRRFAPPLYATILALIGIALGLRLGVWQLARADEKRALTQQFAQGSTSIVPLRTDALGSLPRYQNVRAHGHYDTARQVLLDNMPSAQGRAGFRVLTPFEYAPSEWILVDRGWIAMGATRDALPSVEIDANERELIGRLDELPRPGIRLGDQGEGAGWPRVLNFPQHAQLERVLGRKLANRLVLLDPQAPDGFERVWEFKSGFGPERHIAYAVQWFALAATILIVYLALNLRSKRDDESANSH